MKGIRAVLGVLILSTIGAGIGFAAPCDVGQVEAQPGVCIIDGAAVPKYVTPLVIPPVMNNVTSGPRRGPNNYDIAVRQFQQQILPGGIWDVLNGRTDAYPSTTVWSYGPKADPLPDASVLGVPAGVAPAPNSQFNYPAYTVETRSNTPVKVRWRNELKDNFGAGPNFLPHLLPVDQTLHWANPPQDCFEGAPRTDCMGMNPAPYTGPVPIITHVHGAHVDPHSDGYPEAWFLPAASNIPGGYATKGTFFDDATGTNPGTLGYADFSYRQDQPATTLWYHDHSLGMTRSNVYAGPAGFWLVRGGANDKADNVRTRFLQWDGILPGPAPERGDTVLELNAPGVLGAKDKRRHIREIPIAIQDRTFKADGSLFYPDNRAFFEGVAPDELQILFAPDSDIAPIWNPEAFFNTIVVNGTTWPALDVAPALYRFRLLNGCNSRFLNLSLKIVSSPIQALVGKELSFYQIGAEQGFLPKVAEIRTGFATPLPGDGNIPNPANRVTASDPDQALLMALAERADVLVDFRFLPQGTVVQMYNTGPDEPFGGFSGAPVAGDEPTANPATTGQVMRFVVKWNLFTLRDLITTSPWALKLNAEGPLAGPAVTRQVSLNEVDSDVVCVLADADGAFVVPIVQVACDSSPPEGQTVVPFGPKAALLGVLGAGGAGVPLNWQDMTGTSTQVEVRLQDGTTKMVPVTENPTLGDIEDWEMSNFTADAHPIHLHLVRFQVVGRAPIGDPVVEGVGVEPWETGYKDTVISYPGQITKVRAKFDIEGLYVWHCHIVEHEDNEMMRPYVVSAAAP
jgi:FtsP/CotA-like multicopper oxidase with cupredoxin domain